MLLFSCSVFRVLLYCILQLHYIIVFLYKMYLLIVQYCMYILYRNMMG